MEVRRGPNPVSVERTIGVDFTREELLQVLGDIASKRTGTVVKFDNLQGTGVDNKLTTLSLVGIEQVPIVWTSNKAEVPAPKTDVSSAAK